MNSSKYLFISRGGSGERSREEAEVARGKDLYLGLIGEVSSGDTQGPEMYPVLSKCN